LRQENCEFQASLDYIGRTLSQAEREEEGRRGRRRRRGIYFYGPCFFPVRRNQRQPSFPAVTVENVDNIFSCIGHYRCIYSNLKK
jgi:hypothetical protein